MITAKEARERIGVADKTAQYLKEIEDVINTSISLNFRSACYELPWHYYKAVANELDKNGFTCSETMSLDPIKTKFNIYW